MVAEDRNDIFALIDGMNGDEIEDEEIDPAPEGEQSIIRTIIIPLLLIAAVSGVIAFIFLT